MSRYTAYKGTRYEYKTTVPNKKRFAGGGQTSWCAGR